MPNQRFKAYDIPKQRRSAQYDLLDADTDLHERIHNPIQSGLEKYFAINSVQDISVEAHTGRWRKELRKLNRRADIRDRKNYHKTHTHNNKLHVAATHDDELDFDYIQDSHSYVRDVSDKEIESQINEHTRTHTERDIYGLPIHPIKAPRPANSKIPTKKKYVKFTLQPSTNNRMSLTSVCGGRLRGKRLLTPSVYLRPMMSKVKKALFSLLTSFGVFAPIHNTKVLDLFCGTGSCGIESLSRGASEAVFIDISTECCEVVAANLRDCSLSDKGRVIRAPAEEVLQSPQRFAVNESFDVVFICPPYEQVSYSTLMHLTTQSHILKSDTIVFVEFPKELGTFPVEMGPLKGYRCRFYGRTVVAVYVCNPTEKWNLKPRPDEFFQQAQ